MDDPEYEVEDVRAHPRSVSSARRTQAMPPGTLLSRRWRLALAAVSILLALIVIVSVWLPLHNQSPAVTGFPSPTIPVPPTRVLEPTPLPITSALGLPPTNCPTAPPLTTVAVPAFDGFHGGPVQLSGHAPVWISLGLPQSITDVTQSTPPSTALPVWPSLFIVWEVGPGSHPTATVAVHDLRTGTLAWWAVGGNSPQVPILVLGPPPDEPAPPAQGYLGYLTNLFITRASCYEMTASWPGGSWSLIFAAGQGS